MRGPYVAGSVSGLVSLGVAGWQDHTGTGDTAPIPRVAATVRSSRAAPWQVRLLQGAGLVLVAVLAGLIWWVVRHDTVIPAAQRQPVEGTARQDPLTSGAFDYSVAAGPVMSGSCVDHSYGKIQEWFAEHPCARLSRGLYTTTASGARVLVSVSVVTMPTHADAATLYELAFTSGTGNVSDLVRDGAATIPNAPSVAKGEYKSKIVGPRVTIVEANFFGEVENKATLARVASDARRLSATLR